MHIAGINFLRLIFVVKSFFFQLKSADINFLLILESFEYNVHIAGINFLRLIFVVKKIFFFQLKSADINFLPSVIGFKI